MKTYAKIGLGLAAGAAVGLTALYFVGKRKIAVTDPAAADSVGAGGNIAAGWNAVFGARTGSSVVGTFTAPFTAPNTDGASPNHPERVAGAGIVGDSDALLSNVHSAPNKAQLAVSGLYDVKG